MKTQLRKEGEKEDEEEGRGSGKEETERVRLSYKPDALTMENTRNCSSTLTEASE